MQIVSHLLHLAPALALLLGLMPAHATLYGQSMVHNSPTQSKLVRIDPAEGNLTELGVLGPSTGPWVPEDPFAPPSGLRAPSLGSLKPNETPPGTP
jgi:hypothetical protein